MPDEPTPALPDNLSVMDKMKVYAIEVVLHKVGLAATANLLSLATVFFLAHQGTLEAWGVNYIAVWSPDWLATHDISGSILLIELDTTSLKAIAWAITIVVGFFVTGGHHAIAGLLGKPQTGGQRATDT